MLRVCGAGADGSGPPGGGTVQPHPEAYCRNQLPICGPYPGRHEHTAGHSAATGAGIATQKHRQGHAFRGGGC